MKFCPKLRRNGLKQDFVRRPQKATKRFVLCWSYLLRLSKRRALAHCEASQYTPFKARSRAVKFCKGQASHTRQPLTPLTHSGKPNPAQVALVASWTNDRTQSMRHVEYTIYERSIGRLTVPNTQYAGTHYSSQLYSPGVHLDLLPTESILMSLHQRR